MTRICFVPLAVFAVFVAVPSSGLAQFNRPTTVNGLFGQRTLGQTLKPASGLNSQFAQNGIILGSGGQFIGRGQGQTMMFPGMPWQYNQSMAAQNGYLQPRTQAVAQPNVNAGTNVQALQQQAAQQVQQQQLLQQQMLNPANQRVVPQANPQQAPTGPVGPDQWLRTPGGAAVQPAGAQINPATGAAIAGNAAVAPVPARPMPPPVEVGFSVPAVGVDPAVSVARVLDRIGDIKKVSPITVTIVNDTAVLQGRVATERDRMLAESIARFQPGIWQVRNELVVETAARAAVPSGR